MAIPNQSFTIRDNGLDATALASNIPLFIGPSSAGTTSAINTLSSPDIAATTHGQGPLAEEAACYLADAGGYCLSMKLAASTAAANGSVTASGGGPTVTLSGTPLDDYDARVEIVAGGALGTATFRYYLDGLEASYSPVITVPAGGTYLLPNTGVTVTFAAGTYVAAETYSWTSTGAKVAAGDLTAAVAALIASQEEWDYIVLCGDHGDSAAMATLYAALDGHLTTLKSNALFNGLIMDAGSSDSVATTKTSFASSTSSRIMPCYGKMRRLSAKPFTGFVKPLRNLVSLAATRAGGNTKVSTDLGRVASGPIPSRYTEPTHNEAVAQSMHDFGMTTVRTLRGKSGFYLTSGVLRPASGSDFTLWQYRRIMDLACARVSAKQQDFLNGEVRTNADGTILEEDARRWETVIEQTLSEVLLKPKNASGTRGYVSAASYTIDRTVNVNSTQTLVSEVSIRPLGYAKNITTTLGFAVSVAAAA